MRVVGGIDVDHHLDPRASRLARSPLADVPDGQFPVGVVELGLCAAHCQFGEALGQGIGPVGHTTQQLEGTAKGTCQANEPALFREQMADTDCSQLRCQGLGSGLQDGQGGQVTRLALVLVRAPAPVDHLARLDFLPSVCIVGCGQAPTLTPEACHLRLDTRAVLIARGDPPGHVDLRGDLHHHTGLDVCCGEQRETASQQGLDLLRLHLWPWRGREPLLLPDAPQGPLAHHAFLAISERRQLKSLAVWHSGLRQAQSHHK